MLMGIHLAANPALVHLGLRAMSLPAPDKIYTFRTKRYRKAKPELVFPLLCAV